MKCKFLLLAFICFTSILHSQTSLQKINLKQGVYNVGYKHYTLIDSSRTYQIKNDFSNKEVYRPIPISIWYPSTKPDANKTNTILDYLQVLKEEEEWKHLPDYFILDWFSYLWNTPQNKAHLKEEVNAIFNATALLEKFPVIIYHPSFQKTSIENFALMEYLASHGYIVIATPSRGAKTKNLEDTAVNNITSQVRNIEFIINHLHRLKNVYGDKIALMGYSFGGLVNTILAMKNKTIDALISLDGTERYNFTLLEKLPFYNPDKLTIPYVHFAQKDIPEEILKSEKIPARLNYTFQLFDSIRNADVYSYKFHHLTHTYFNSFDVLFANRDKRQDKSDSEIMKSYNILANHVLQFANAILKDDKVANKFFKNTPQENGFSTNLITLKNKKKVLKPFDYKYFNDLAYKQNFKNLIGLYKLQKEKHPELKLNEGILNTLGLKLSFNPKTKEEGINVFLLATYLYPNSSNLYDSLAEAYYYHKDYKNAIVNFKKSLMLNPKNQNAINRLKELHD